MQDLITIKQLPILEEQFAEIGKKIDEKLERCQKMSVSEENVKDVKKIRALLNKESSYFSEQFKTIKEKVLKPWLDTEEAYKANIRNKYNEADSVLKEKIAEIESGLKAEKESEIRRYFEEHKLANKLDFINFENLELKIGLSTSIKSLKDTVDSFIARVKDDLELIDTQVAKAAIMAEYKIHLNVSRAIKTVNDRMIREAEELQNAEERAKTKAEEKAHAEEIKKTIPEAFEKPTIETAKTENDKPAETYIAFRVYGNMAELQTVVKFLNDNKYRYEQI